MDKFAIIFQPQNLELYWTGFVATLELLATVEGNQLAMEFRDDGRPFDPLSQPTPDLYADIADRPIGGLGVHLIRELAEEVAYARDDGQNILRIVLHIPAPERTA